MSDTENEIEDIVDDVEDVVKVEEEIDNDYVDNESDYNSDTDDDVSVATVDENVNTTITVVKPEKRITSTIMSKAEYVKVLGIRATHIDHGAPVYTDITDITDTKEMAIKEIKEKKCPLSIRRFITNDICEIWSVNEMTLPIGVGSVI